MTNLMAKKTPLIAALICAGSVAQADVTPNDVWQEWNTTLRGFGYEIDATEKQAGNDLNISDLTLSIILPEDEGTVTFTGLEVSFRDNGDGSVSIAYPSQLNLNLSFDATDAEEEDVEAEINYNTVGLTMVASGSPDAMTYTYSAASMAMALKNLIVDDAVIELGQAKMSLINVSGIASLIKQGATTITRSFQADELQYMVDVADPENAEERVFVKGSLNNLISAGTGTLPEDLDTDDFAMALANGLAVAGKFEYGGGESQISVNADGENFSIKTSTAGGNFDISMDADALNYNLTSTDLAVDVITNQFPFPVSIALAEVGFNLGMPLAPSEDLQDFSFGVTLGEFTISDVIWGMVDPVGQLPRDPATVAFDLSGKVKLLAELLNPEALAASDEQPGEIHALNINALKVSAAGADLTGKGAVTFDNTDIESFDGMPRPEGTINLALKGGNALLDKLIAMGLVPEQEAMGIRMMVGMFSVPNGPDDLESTIEFTPEGQILANGQRLK